MELNWPIVFGILFVGFIFIPGIVFLLHLYKGNKKEHINK